MVRHTAIVIVCSLILAGCDRHPDMPKDLMARGGPPPPDIAVQSDAPAPPGEPAQQFSYRHSWSLILSHAALPRHFEAARDACLKDKALDCRLISANLAGGADGQSAQLSVLLPHASLDRFEHLLRDPRKGETTDDVRVTARATQAQSVETAAADSNRKVAQLSAYRDRLAEIAKRPNLSVDDLIKLEAEQARVETDLDTALAEQRGIDSGLKREQVDVTMNEDLPPGPSPLVRALSNAADTLGENTAAMLSFVIGALPWLPLIAGGVWLLVRLVRLAWRRKALAKPVAG